MSDTEKQSPPQSGTRVGSYREWTEKVISGELPPPPVAQLIGFQMLEVGEGTARFELETDPERHGNPMGTLHGGILCDVADAAMGTAIGTTLEPGETFTTLELKANYFKPVFKTTLTATAKIVKRTKSVAMIDCDVVDAKGSLVARLSSTCMILRGEKAAGR